MSSVLALLLAIGVVLPEPLALSAVREPATLEVAVELQTELPAELVEALDAGAEVRLAYPIRVKAKRRTLWDRKLWSGELITIAVFDPVTGRYRCEVVLDGLITSSGEAESAVEARRWLTHPPPVRIELPEERREADVRVRARAVFARGTTWLIFPTQRDTPWIEVVLAHGTAAAGSEP